MNLLIADTEGMSHLQCLHVAWHIFCAGKWVVIGQRLTPTLAIALIEAAGLSLSLLYCRYVDGSFIICSAQDEMGR